MSNATSNARRTQSERYEYHLKHWGEINNPDQRWLEKDLGVTESDHWFDSAEKRAEFRAKLKACADTHACCIVFVENEGTDVRKRTTVQMTMRLDDGRAFEYEHDFGYAYSPENAHYMWRDGNYCCDCNRSLFLKDAGHAVEEMDCGDTITLENFRVTQVGGLRNEE